MEHKFLRNFVDGVWTKESRDIVVLQEGEYVTVDMDEYAKEHGINLPDSKGYKKPKKEINTTTDIKEHEHGDMEQQNDEGDTDVN